MEIDIFRLGVFGIATVIALIFIFLRRDTIKGFYKGSCYLIFLGLFLFLIILIRIYNLNEGVSISLIIDYLLFKKIGARGADPYGRAIGYLLIVIGIELFIIGFTKKKKLKSQ